LRKKGEKMRGNQRYSAICIVLLITLLAIGLVATAGCGQSAPREGDTVFTPRESAPGGFSGAANEAKDEAKRIRDLTPPSLLGADGETPKEPKDAPKKDADEYDPSYVDWDTVRTAERHFSNGNNSYQRMNFKEALDSYDRALDSQAYHYGALNNRALALLQLERNNEALVAALVVLELFPDSHESCLNVQVATYAAGYDPIEFWNRYAHIINSFEKDNVELQEAYEYNGLYARMEFNIDPEKKKESNKNYKQYQAALEKLIERNPHDKDIEDLRVYLEGIGMITGFTPYPKAK
jgi:tetratricopeptide (TPR) repeat protein